MFKGENHSELVGMHGSLEMNTGMRVRELLEDFEIVSTINHMALISNQGFVDFRNNVYAAVLASSLGLASLDYTKRRYCNEEPDQQKNEVTRYIEAYKTAKTHIHTVMSRLSTEGKQPPSLGVFGASLVLERLPSSFFSAHLLYRLGNEYDAHAVSRLILEQIAWAHCAYSCDNIEKIRTIITTKTLSKLKNVFPKCGRLYSFLSRKAHISYSSHGEFLELQRERNLVLLSHTNFYEYTFVILTLADLFAVVWELTQLDYMNKLESIEIKNGFPAVVAGRPFQKVIQNHLKDFKEAANK
jgi:hypothetical protein